MLWVYAFGVPMAYGLLLFMARDAITTARPTALASSQLHEGYKPNYYWWELVTVARKLVTVGVATLIYPGKMAQLRVVLLLVICFHLLLVVAQPYAEADEEVLALVSKRRFCCSSPCALSSRPSISRCRCPSR